ncbi:receptor-type tyrosine-protein phosphatase F-like [Planoprotostelium fungivorum]|uniref:protein-tyrosine-phosphatase n=1 Tax=Planoprotostelium fungivorum TaxID=1890364 RepID=A0A2P6NPS8_9EUKA|nr:receptor-type tyrosine-protein phosphatase F-like [Planoprotostelium fungivorum]
MGARNSKRGATESPTAQKKKFQSPGSYEFKPTYNLKKNLDRDIPEEEFKAIEWHDTINGALSYGTTEEAFKDSNKAKNRYQVVVPYDHCRVKLQSADTEGSDYINASYIKGEDNSYIAAQGPLPETTADFWKMVWDDDVSVLLMLTKTNENGRKKCHQYYPEKEDGDDGIEYGDIKIELASMHEDSKAAVITRKYTLTHKPTSAKRTVVHYQYLGWPDHGVPENTAGIRGLIQSIEEQIAESHSTGPILVHCSAGIGRTGTFMTIHIHIQQLRKHMQSSPDQPFQFEIYNTVKELRKQRTGMVQQPEQYRFCYEAILDESKKLGYVPPDKNWKAPTTAAGEEQVANTNTSNSPSSSVAALSEADSTTEKTT